MEQQVVEEAVTHAVQQTVDSVEVVKAAFRIHPALAASAAALAFVGGAAVGATIAQRKLKLKYEELATQEIEEAKEHYAKLNKAGDYETPEKAAAKLMPVMVRDTTKLLPNAVIMTEAVLTEDAVTAIQSYRPSEPLERNVFTDRPQPPASTLTVRDTTKPYRITENEFFENEPEYDQTTITYYTGDDVLADESDMVITETDKTVGDDNLARLAGQGEDLNTLHVRNDQVKLDFEIVRSSGKYSVEVAGLDDDGPSLQHSATPLRRRRRFNDE